MYRQLVGQAALEASNQWNKLEQGIRELENSTVILTEAINEVDAKDLAEEPEVLIERTNKEIEEFSKDYLNIKKITAKI